MAPRKKPTPAAPPVKPTAKATAHLRRLHEMRAEARSIVAARQLRRLKESAALEFDWVSPWAEMLQRQFLEPGWFPLNTPSARKFGHYFPFFQTEQQLGLLRDLSRILVGTNNHATGMLNGLCSFVVGPGMRLKATPAGPNGKALKAKLTDWFDEWADRVMFDELQQEAFWRSREDGDALVRCFPDDGWMKLRFVWPEQLVCPPGESTEVYAYGVRTPRDDAAAVEAFWVGELGNPSAGEEVPVEEVEHFKSNSRTGVKRGLPDFAFGTKDALDAAARLTRNLGEGSAVRAAIAYMRQHANATEAEVNEVLGAQADYRQKRPFRDSYDLVSDIKPGTVIDHPEGLEHVEPPADPQAPAHAQIVALLLRSAGVRWNAPEWLVSGDASNMGAYTSSLVAESPFVRAVIRSQGYYRRRFLRLVRRALDCAVAHGLLPAEVLSAVIIDLVPPTPEVRNKLEETERAAVEIPLGVDSRQRYCEAQDRDSERVFAENQEYQDTWGADGEAPTEGADPDDPQASGGGQGGGLFDSAGRRKPFHAPELAEGQEWYTAGEYRHLLEADRPGLVKKVITNKAGRKQTVWVRSQPKPTPKEKPDPGQAAETVKTALKDPSLLTADHVAGFAAHLGKMSKEQLKDLSRTLKTKVSGVKQELVDRLLAHVRKVIPAHVKKTPYGLKELPKGFELPSEAAYDSYDLVYNAAKHAGGKVAAVRHDGRGGLEVDLAAGDGSPGQTFVIGPDGKRTARAGTEPPETGHLGGSKIGGKR